MNTKYSNIKGYPGYYISKRGTLFTSLTFSDKERDLIMIDHKEKGLSIKKISLKYGYSRYFIHQVLKGIR